MIAAWDSYQLIVPSRPVHEDSAGEDHWIDEWADPAVGPYLSWICRTQSIDVVIVNYTWMSFCFNYIPNNIFKICDTHDVVGGRRAMLERNGLGAEYFHTTESEEARGLARADLVWAIKPSEQQYFEQQLALPNCLTVLHAEPERHWWTGPASDDGWLRAGFIGARNNINRRNIERFLDVALPIIEGYMAPVKILIAGSVTDYFRNLRHPNVEVLGRVPEIADFYRAIDVVIAPMEFSTGLKIKVSEALSSGAPLIALEHATEGYPTTEPLHLLPDFKRLTLELVKLAFDSTVLQTLADRSREICANIRVSVLASLEETRKLLLSYRRNSLCIVLPMVALNQHSLLYDHLMSSIDYFRFLTQLNLYVVGPPAKFDRNLFGKFGRQFKVFAAPQLMAELGPEAPESWTAIPFAELADTWGIYQAYFLCENREEIRPGAGRLSRVIIRFDAVELSGGDPSGLISAVAGSAHVFVVGSAVKRLELCRSYYGVEAAVPITYRRTGCFESLKIDSEYDRSPDLVILGKCSDQPLMEHILRLCLNLELSGVCVDVTAPGVINLLVRDASSGEIPTAVTHARLVVDLTEDSNLAAILHEAAQAADIPVIHLLRGPMAGILNITDSPLFPTSIGTLLRTVARGLSDPEFHQLLRTISRDDLQIRRAKDAGWTWLWHKFRSGHSAASDHSNSAAGLFA